MQSGIFHIAAYRFVELTDLASLRAAVTETGLALHLTGLVLVAPEGINACVAGAEESLRSFLVWLESDPRFTGLETKWSRSDEMPYGKLRVKLKREIIRMNHPQIQPAAGRAASIDARTLRRWLDDGHDDTGREVVLLDTRNAFELEHGAFEGAIDLKLRHFTYFPGAVAERRAELEGKTVVTYCTGGIRCEKAALHLQEIGLQNVLQLDGGILRYFETVGSGHYRGKCFVFDRRIELSPADMIGL